MSIRSAFDSWKGDNFESGERQWTANWLEAGVQYQHWAIGLLQRYDYSLKFDKQTAEFYWLVANKKDLPVGKEYLLDLQANAIHSTGLRISFADDLSNSFSYRVGLSYLQANYMLEGHLKGDATIVDQSDYDYSATIDYAYTEDHLFDRQVNTPKGHGFSLDFMFDYQLTADINWQLQVRDLFARLYWKNSPYTQGASSSDRKEYDENGYVSIDPILTGYEGTRGVYVQKLDPRWHSKVTYQVNELYDLQGQIRYQYEHGLYAIGGSRKLTEQMRLGGSYWPINKALELNLNYRQMKLALTANGLSSSNLQTLWLSFSYGL
ncbi:hypothetical protein ACLKMH_23860 [Psychromonas sp. KJ10-10]|uniref:hypothetical protein n=1 Tax=Psychromonas sp. KJ10-10 TaxID=3391823 RepID=UPI0039B4915D